MSYIINGTEVTSRVKNTWMQYQRFYLYVGERADGKLIKSQNFNPQECRCASSKFDALLSTSIFEC